MTQPSRLPSPATFFPSPFVAAALAALVACCAAAGSVTEPTSSVLLDAAGATTSLSVDAVAKPGAAQGAGGASAPRLSAVDDAAHTAADAAVHIPVLRNDDNAAAAGGICIDHAAAWGTPLPGSWPAPAVPQDKLGPGGIRFTDVAAAAGLTGRKQAAVRTSPNCLFDQVRRLREWIPPPPPAAPAGSGSPSPSHSTMPHAHALCSTTRAGTCGTRDHCAFPRR
jgi:hypothetical protein